jgi:AAA domain
MFVIQYKNQQREIQFQFKRQGLDYLSHPVLTIDQCQGQEANVVILSMVRRPTRFLTKNRFNVALSRVRQTLYFLADRRLFREASKDSGWDCNLMAQDLLLMSDSNNNRGIGNNKT